MNPQTVYLPRDGGEDAFRAAARHCLGRKLAPEQVIFTDQQGGSLFASAAVAAAASDAQVLYVPRRFLELMRLVLCHSADDRGNLLYRLLWRLSSGERELLDRAHDPDVQRATRYAKAVQRETYRLHAFLRFTEQRLEHGNIFVAWFEPEHYVLERAAPFFVDRFRNMHWMIATPIGTAAWREKQLSFGPPVPKRPTRAADAALDEWWTAYYRATFNPARLRVRAMQAQMPRRYWQTMPETALIPELVEQAGMRVQEMRACKPVQPPRFAAAIAGRTAAGAVEASDPWQELRRAAQSCTRCPLYTAATQTVFGRGPLDAPIVFVGEQPGDQEDLAGEPFVGPAGQMFDRALDDAGIDRRRAYVTNAVKHFKFEPLGKRRIHRKPGTVEIDACRPWLQRELATIKPRLVVALGGTAARSLAGRPVAVTKERGRIVEWGGRATLLTVHPSFLLRLPERAAAEAEYEHFVADLRLATAYL